MSQKPIPKEMAYGVPGLDMAITSQSYVSRATNGSSFTSGQQVQFNFIQNAATYIVPESLYLSFRLNITANAGASPANDNDILGIPGVSCWSRSDLYANSTSIETVNNYGAITQALMHSKMNVAQKMGLSNALGLEFTDNNANDVDSVKLAGGSGAKVLNCAVPLNNVLANASRYIPLDVAQFILYLTVADVNEFVIKSVDGSAATTSLFSVDNLELHYKCISLDAGTDMAVKSQYNDKFEISFKSQSYASTVAQIANASSGSQAFPFANSLTSIKSLWCLFCRSGDGFKNNASYDPTQGTGTIYWEVAGKNYPQNPIQTERRNSVLEFLEAIHGLHASPDAANTSMSVNNYASSTNAYSTADVKNLFKAYFGVNVERLPGNYMVSGITSQNSNIALRLNIDGGATNTALNIIQVFHHDLILKYNVQTGAFFTMR